MNGKVGQNNCGNCRSSVVGANLVVGISGDIKKCEMWTNW